MKYEYIERLSAGEVESAVLRDDPDELLYAVISTALHSDDPAWAEGVCVRLAKHRHSDVRGNAILGFAHIARIHGALTERTVKPLIEAALLDENDYVRAQAVAASDDVELFLKWKVNRPS